MNFKQIKIDGLVVIEPKIYEDERGYFFESFRQDEFEKNIGKIIFVQENESKSSYGILRGLHYQKAPFSQSKLVKVVVGKIIDVAVDLRKNSPTFGKYVSLELSDKNKMQLFIPRGFAHGFVTLSKTAIVQYKVDNYYSQKHDSGIAWNDKTLSIDWGIDRHDIILSKKDNQLPYLKEVKYFE